MKHLSMLSRVLMIALTLSACGASAEATPTVDPVDLQSTVAALAFTMIAETQAAIPTATPSPPTATITEIPAPTNTFLPLPALGEALTQIPNSDSGGGDPCIDKVLPASLQGEAVRIRLTNSTKATVAVSVYLQQTTANSQCGYRSYNLTPGQSIVINDLVAGCYTLWAWNPISEDYFIVTNGTTCIDGSDNWAFDISTRDIRLR